MGLDISYVRGLSPVECSDEDCEHIRVYPDSDFADRMEPLKPGHYTARVEGKGFRAGSYSGYNAWREQLCYAALGTSPTTVWGSPDEYRNSLFYELINFSDCEGTIGPLVAAKLAEDFAAFDKQARVVFDEYGYGKYREWRKAFEMAQDDGAVLFH